MPFDNQTIMRVSRPVTELQNFANTIRREAAPTVEAELQELREWPRRWFERIRELIETESQFQSFPVEEPLVEQA